MSVLEPLLCKQALPMLKILMIIRSLPRAINKVDDRKFSSLLLVINQAHKFLASIKRHQVEFNNYRSIIIIICMVATPRRPLAPQTRCIVNVISPVSFTE